MTRDERLFREFERLANRDDFYDWLGLYPITVETGRLVGGLEYDDRLTMPSPPGPGSVHGGVVASLIDVSGVGAVLSTLENPVTASIATTNLDIDFTETAESTLRSEAVVTAVDKPEFEATVTVTTAGESDTDSVLIAEGTVICRVSNNDSVVETFSPHPGP
ncbi:MAG: PaaI family thioesterase [Halorhabdus sp.]